MSANRVEIPSTDNRIAVRGRAQTCAVSARPKGEKPSLGKNRQISHRDAECDVVALRAEALKRRYRMSDIAARLLPNERVAQCHRLIAPRAGSVRIMRADGEAYFQNLIVCNRVWECPVCSARIAAQRAEELHEAIGAAGRLGLQAVMVTFTVQHHAGLALDELLNRELKALNDFKRARGWSELRDEYDWRGDIRALEATYGGNGWHPHIHLIVFLGRHLDAIQLEGFRRWIAERWSKMLAKNGAQASLQHGVDVTTGGQYFAEYCAKFGRAPEGAWGLGDEMTRTTAKRGRRGRDGDGLTPWQLLELAGAKRDDMRFANQACHVATPKRAGALFVEYAQAFKGRSQLHYSRGLRDMLALAPPAPEGAEEPIPANAELVYEMGADLWKFICKLDLRGDLRAVAMLGRDELMRWLEALGVVWIDLTQFDVSPPKGGNHA